MNMHLLVVLGLLSAVTAVVAGGLFFARSLRIRHLRQIAQEKSQGNLRLRRRMERLTGRLKDQYEGVTRAETMRGYVWIVWTRRSREPFTEQIGWAPFRWLARRRLRQHLSSGQKS